MIHVVLGVVPFIIGPVLFGELPIIRYTLPEHPPGFGAQYLPGIGEIEVGNLTSTLDVVNVHPVATNVLGSYPQTYSSAKYPTYVTIGAAVPVGVGVVVVVGVIVGV